MSDNLFDILDDCLSRLDSGEDIESCLGRYPRHASELRPLLLAAMDASSIVPAGTVPPGVMNRGKARLLNAAAEMREQKAARKFAFPFFKRGFEFRRIAAVLAVLLAFVLLGGTGLVRASSASMPGDQLYPVKRTWEQVLLQVITDPQARAELEIEFEHERIDELNHLLGLGQEAEVEFSGQVTGIFPDQMVVAGFIVRISETTKVDQDIVLNSRVEVEGQTLPDGSVQANEIKLKEGDNQADDSTTSDSPESKSGSGEDDSLETKTQEPTEVEDSQSIEETKETAEITDETDTPQLSQFEIEGNIQSISGNQIVVDKKTVVFNSSTEIRGSLAVGATVKVKGFVQLDGSLLASRIEIVSSDSGSSTLVPTAGGGDSVSESSTPELSPTGEDSGSGSGTPQPTETPKPNDD